MSNVLRIVLIIILFIGGTTLFWLHYNRITKSNPEKTHWRVKLKPNNYIISWPCQANIFYTFKSRHGFDGVSVGGGWKDIKVGTTFNICFPKKTTIRFNGGLDGVWFKTGYIEIWKEKRLGRQVIYLTTTEYSDFSFKLFKGNKLKIPQQEELFYLGYFKGWDRTLKQKYLVKNDDSYFFRFWDDWNVKFKAAEVPFFMTINFEPFLEGFKINNNSAGRAYFMESGDFIKLPVWLDKGDSCYLKGWNLSRGFAQIKLGSKWHEARGSSYYAKGDGFIYIKALKKFVLTEINIQRNKHWDFDLKPGKTRRIKVYSGDILKSSCRSRYYVNGQILEACSHTHKQWQDGYIEFKASINPRPIYVSVLERRGY